jgi:hypothetical protein
MTAAPVALLAVTACVVTTGCGDSAQPRRGASETPQPAPQVELDADEKRAWKRLPPDRSAIPVLLYHGIGPESAFSNDDDAFYGVDFAAFAKQMTMIARAGYRTVGLQTFIDFVEGKPVELPRRPLLLTFDDARADSWTGADGILSKLGFDAAGHHALEGGRRSAALRRRERALGAVQPMMERRAMSDLIAVAHFDRATAEQGPIGSEGSA